MDIREDDLSGEKIIKLLQEHLENMLEITPAGSVHAFNLARLRSADISFWSIWEGDELLGCGALKELEANCGEIKSMRTATAHRAKGVASRMLEHIMAEATRRAYDCLYLETGSKPEFLAAHTLYQKYGFSYCGPFGDYKDDLNSVFMIKKLGTS